MKKNKLNIYLFVVIAFLGFSCGDIFSPKKKIIGNYYLVEGDTKSNKSICYRTGDDYIIKIPTQVLEYGYSDSFLVAKTKNFNNTLSYYIIDRTKDFDLAREENFRVGPISEKEYINKWQKRLKMHLKKAL
jgi:hypothetical protein